MTQTTHYQLNQWEPEDQVRRTDFNADNAKLDAALAAKADQADTNSRLAALEGRTYIVVGTYTGSGAASRTISLGFQPKAVLVEPQDGNRSGGYGGLALPGVPIRRFNSNATDKYTTVLEITSTGFRVSYVQYYSNTNDEGQVFTYLALK